LHCGQYFGEPDETTWVQPPRTPPPTTFDPNATIFSKHDKSDSLSYQPTRQRRWPVIVALSLLAGIILMIVGGLIAVSLIRNAGGLSVDLPDNNRLTVLTTPTPTPRAIAQPQATPQVSSEEKTAPTPKAIETVEDQTAPPVIIPTDRPVIEWADGIRDGGNVAWKLPPGLYRLELTASNDGVTAEWLGANCPKTRPMTVLGMTCDLPRTGQLVITNPTTFGLGASSSVTIKITKTWCP
jgi:hypothetical protein